MLFTRPRQIQSEYKEFTKQKQLTVKAEGDTGLIAILIPHVVQDVMVHQENTIEQLTNKATLRIKTYDAPGKIALYDLAAKILTDDLSSKPTSEILNSLLNFSAIAYMKKINLQKV